MDRESPDQTVHQRSLIRVFTVHCQNDWILLEKIYGTHYKHLSKMLLLSAQNMFSSITKEKYQLKNSLL